MFVYCKKCGLIKNIKSQNNACPVCETQLMPVPDMYLTASGIMFTSQSSRTEFENLIKASPEYDETIASKRNELLVQKEEVHKLEVEKKVSEYNSSRPQKYCPVCHSTSLTKISNVGKIAKVGVFGILGAGDLGKTWRCNTCGCKF